MKYRLFFVFYVLPFLCLFLLNGCSSNNDPIEESKPSIQIMSNTKGLIASANENMSIDNYVLVSKTQVGRAFFNYTYKASITNRSVLGAKEVSAKLTSLSASTVVMSGDLAFGDVAAGATVQSINTFTIRIDRTQTFNQDNLKWDIQAFMVKPVVSLERKQTLINAATGGTITITENESLYSKGLEIIIPPHALSQDTLISVGDCIKNIPPAPDGYVVGGLPLEFKPDGEIFSSPITMKIPYTDDELLFAGVQDPTALLVSYYDVANSQWTSLNIESVDTDNKQIIVTTNHFCIIAKLYNTLNLNTIQIPGYDDIRAYVQTTWKVVDTEQNIENIIYNMDFEGIPYGSYIGALMLYEATWNEIGEKNYYKATRKIAAYVAKKGLGKFGGELSFLSPYIVFGTTMYDLLELYADCLDEASFNKQVDWYLYWRNQDVEKDELQVRGGDYTDDNGWILYPGYCLVACHPGATGKFTPEDVWAAGEYLYLMNSDKARFVEHVEEVKEKFIQDLNTEKLNSMPVSIIQAAEGFHGLPPFNVTLDPSSSYAKNGATITGYLWNIQGNKIQRATATQIPYTFELPGNYRVTLTVTDSKGSSSTTEKIVKVVLKDPNDIPPTAFFTTSVSATEPLTYFFDSSNSSDPEGNIINYSWSFGDGMLQKGRQVTHTFEKPGKYTVRLTITDENFNNDSYEKSIFAFTPTNIKAVANKNAISLAWDVVVGAIKYVLYWLTESGVTPENGNMIETDTNSFVHSGLIEGLPYYYIVTAMGGYGESAPSEEVTSVPFLGNYISGTIIAGNEPLEEVTVSCVGGGANISMITALDGSFFISDLPNGSYTLSFSKTGYMFNPQSISVNILDRDITFPNDIAAYGCRLTNKYTLINLHNPTWSQGVNWSYSRATGINNNGQIVGYHHESGIAAPHSFIIENGNYYEYSTPNGVQKINNEGAYIGQRYFWESQFVYCTHAYLMPGEIDLGTLQGQDLNIRPSYKSEANAINQLWQIVGWSEDVNHIRHAVLWDNGEIFDLGTFNGSHSEAVGINSFGNIIGNYYSGTTSEPHAFIWKNGIKTDLVNAISYAHDINDNNQVVGRAWPGQSQKAYIWQNGALTYLDFGENGTAERINNCGQIVGYCNGNVVLYENNQIKLFSDIITNYEGWSSFNIYDINDKGQMVGVATFDRQERAILLDPIN